MIASSTSQSTIYNSSTLTSIAELPELRESRESLDRLIADAEKGLFTHVVVESLDRLTRKLAHAVNLFETLIELDIVMRDVEDQRVLSLSDVATKGACKTSRTRNDYPAQPGGNTIQCISRYIRVAQCFSDTNATLILSQRESSGNRTNRKQSSLERRSRLCAAGMSAAKIAELI